MYDEIVDIFNKEYSKQEYPYGKNPSYACEFIYGKEINEKKVIKDQGTISLDILDIGGGTGRDAICFANQPEVNSMHVFDISDVAVKKGNERNKSTIKFSEINVFEVESLGESDYDVICSYQLLHFGNSDQIQNLMKKISVALKPGGRMYHMFLDQPKRQFSDGRQKLMYSHSKNSFKNTNGLEIVEMERIYVMEYHGDNYHSHRMSFVLGKKE